MAQYIDKDALVAKIERRIKTNKECMLGLRNLDYYQGKVDALKDTLSSLGTLEVKEVALEKEIKRYFNVQPIMTRSKGVDYKLIPSTEKIAKHFFELGLRASNPLTWEDISSLKLLMDEVENEFKKGLHNDKSYAGYCEEVLKRFKEQKGE